jgi:hypothetical protein
MDYDLRTCDSDYYFVLNFMNMTLDEYITELIIECKNDFEQFWERNIDAIKDVDISNIRIMAFHVVGSLDECKEIKSKGLMNLQDVLSSDTSLKRLLGNAGIEFDISRKIVTCNGKEYNIDYEKYRNRHCLSGIDEKLSSIAHRVFYDFCVNGFLVNDNVFDYGTGIHERPEFLMTLGQLFPQAQKLESIWRSKAKSYSIVFYATIGQVHRFNFELDEFRDPPYERWLELDDEMKIKKWMLSHAIDRAANELSMQFLYVRDDVIIPSNQILMVSGLQYEKSSW